MERVAPESLHIVNCSSCTFWNPVTQKLDARGCAVGLAEAGKVENSAGECRRYPPRSAVSVGGGYRAFPITRYGDGCGEHKFVTIDSGSPSIEIVQPIDIPITTVKKLGRPKKVVDGKDSQG